MFTPAEWRNLKVDIMHLADPEASLDNKLVTVQRIREYKCFKGGTRIDM